MFVIPVRNVHDALPEALYRLRLAGIERPSRNGPVRMFPGPVTTVYERPEERVLLWPERDANPFFHLMESLWMLAGRNDVEFVARYVKRMKDFSDDGVTFHGAYGYRWRVWFEVDQVMEIIAALRANPEDRRCVLGMWDSSIDLGRAGKDFPCNLSATLQITHEGRLDMVVHNRSNDMIWGAYGANAVHFSVLQEFIARAVGVPVGRYYQVSSNFHAYLAVLEKVEHLADHAASPYPTQGQQDTALYTRPGFQHFPLLSSPEAAGRWLDELEEFLVNPHDSDHRMYHWSEPFFLHVAIPMARAHTAFRERQYETALEEAARIQAEDWRVACVDWLRRRVRATDDGVQA